MEASKCRNCTYYYAYYRQLAIDFCKLNHGFCTKHEKPQQQSEICEQYVSNEKKEKMREKIRLHELDRALNSINDIALILKEKKKEK